MAETETPEFFQPTCQGYLLKVQVVPGARRTEVVGRHGDRLKVRVAALPEKGRANETLLDFLAEALKVPRHALHLLGGATSRAKVVVVQDLSPELRDRIRKLLPPA